MLVVPKETLVSFDDDILSSLYRVNSRHQEDSLNRYRYYSKTINHHAYFISKRLFQIITANYDIHLTNPRDRQLLSKLDLAIECLMQEEDFSLSITECLVPENFMNVVTDNSYSNHHPHKDGVIERVDTNYYGGGYGFKSPWLELLNTMTLIENHETLHSQDIIVYLTYMKKEIAQYGQDNLKRIRQTVGLDLLPTWKQDYIISRNIAIDESSHIEKLLKDIVSNELYQYRSSLEKDQVETIDDIIDTYCKTKTLLLERKKDYISRI